MVKLIKADFHGEVIQFNGDGWFNATNAAKKFNKDLSNWMRMPSTIEYIKAFKSNSVQITELTKAKKGKYGGTWVHPKLGVLFARWCDVEFAIWCDEQIEKIIHGEPEKEDWKKLRHKAASSYIVMSEMLNDIRKDSGKETKPHHYSNEANLVNWALTGEFKSIDRESLPTSDLDLIAKLEVKNTILMARGVDRDARKEILLSMIPINHKRINK